MARAASRSRVTATPCPEDITCCVCQEKNRYLKQIPCGHKFCHFCLEHIVAKNSNQDHFNCLVCLEVIQVSGGGASDFPLHRATALEPDQDVIAQCEREECESCGTRLHRTRLLICVQCKVVLCDNELCQDEHTADGQTHVLRPRRVAATPIPDAEPVCLKHGHDCDHFCQTCRKTLCKYCLMGNNQQHTSHNVEPVSQSVNTARQHLQEVKSLLEPICRHLDWVSSDVQENIEAFQQEKRRVEHQIRSRASEAMDMIKELQAAALLSLNRLTDPVEKQLFTDSGCISDKLTGLRCKDSHITSTLSDGSDIAILRMETSALDITRNPKSLGKFTSNLPKTIHHVCDHNSGSASTLRGYLQKFIGEPRLQRTKRKVPAVNVVSKLPIAFRGNGPAATFRVCSGGEGLLVWVSVSSGNQTPIQLVDMSKLEVVSQHQAIKHKDNAVLSLVNVDENSAIATSGHSHIHRLFRERGDSEHLPSTQQISIFAKARLRACVAERSPNESTILPSVSNSQRLTDGTPSGLSPTDQFTISRASRPVSVDISSSGHIFAVVDRLHKLHLYRRGATNPFSTFPSEKSEQKGVKVADVCFYKFGEREVLLVADSTKKDVTVMDVQHGCGWWARLMHNSGQLGHPLALNVDPYTGQLLVLCCSGSSGGTGG